MSDSRPDHSIRLLVLVGPTASGKTRLAVRAAHALASEIVSADSRQVYRGLDLGSGKDLAEYGAVTPPVAVHLIDVADPAEVYSVFHYQRDCYRLLERKAREAPYAAGRPLLLVGGTGLFVEAVLRGYRIPNVPEDAALRQALMRVDRELLLSELRGLDEELYRRTDQTSKKRIVRAVEIGRYARNHPVHTSPPPPVRIEHTVFAVDVDADTLDRRIEARLDERLEQGLVDEVAGLLQAGLPARRLVQLGLEYREIASFLLGDKSHDAMRRDLARGIRQLAKRQRTWFRGLERRGIAVRWIAPDDAAALTGASWPERC